MKKVMLLAAMLAMVLAAAVPALAQNVTQVGEGNIACVQTAIQVENNKTQIAVSQYGDATNVNIQAIAQVCNISVVEVENILNILATAPASASSAPASVSASSAPASVSASSAPASVSASSAPAAVQYQYQYATPTASAAAELPPTGGSSLIALGAGVLLVAGGLLARRIVR